MFLLFRRQHHLVVTNYFSFLLDDNWVHVILPIYHLKKKLHINIMNKQPALVIFQTSIIQSVLSTSITVWFGSATRQDRDRLQQIGLQRKSLGQICPPSWTFTGLDSGIAAEPQTQTNCSDCFPLVGATELCLPNHQIQKQFLTPFP